MKKLTAPMMVFCLAALVILTITSCQSDEISTTNETTLEERFNQNAFMFPASAHPLGNFCKYVLVM